MLTTNMTFACKCLFYWPPNSLCEPISVVPAVCDLWPHLIALPYSNSASVCAATRFINEETEAQRAEFICSRSHREEEAGLGPRCQVCLLLSLYFSRIHGFHRTLSPFFKRQILG